MRISRFATLLAAGAVATVGFVLPSTVASAATPPQVTTASLPSVHVGVKYPTTSLKASGGTSLLGSYRWSITAGALPPGMKLSTGGQISGTAPLFVDADHLDPYGVYPITVEVRDAKNLTATRNLQIVVKPAEITTPSLPNAKKGQLYYSQLKFAGACKPGVQVRWRNLPDTPLPAGLKISSSGAISGVAKTPGTHSVTIDASCPGVPFFNPWDHKDFLLTVS